MDSAQQPKVYLQMLGGVFAGNSRESAKCRLKQPLTSGQMTLCEPAQDPRLLLCFHLSQSVSMFPLCLIPIKPSVLAYARVLRLKLRSCSSVEQ